MRRMPNYHRPILNHFFLILALLLYFVAGWIWGVNVLPVIKSYNLDEGNTTFKGDLFFYNLSDEQINKSKLLITKINPSYLDGIHKITFQTGSIDFKDCEKKECSACGVYYQGLRNSINLSVGNHLCDPLSMVLCHEVLHHVIHLPGDEEHKVIEPLVKLGICYHKA